jgi:multisubunit Na+/H+ antiporter MnhC subunit
MSDSRKDQQDEVVVDLRKLTMIARGRGLEYVRPLLMILFLALVVSFAMLATMVHLATRQSDAVAGDVEKAISRL